MLAAYSHPEGVITFVEERSVKRVVQHQRLGLGDRRPHLGPALPFVLQLKLAAEQAALPQPEEPGSSSGVTAADRRKPLDCGVSGDDRASIS
ncbi:hypothetical protein EYF80_052334 [Liparis tanakae]|uniref:Uncharacterized protein n=1 Tax=Liparis tanakae TaxID=230148 RepID=A0A4Z2F9C3_9TELE|nr:hypothetical protein EYF80_052334 [Liparis tanakae]